MDAIHSMNDPFDGFGGFGGFGSFHRVGGSSNIGNRRDGGAGFGRSPFGSIFHDDFFDGMDTFGGMGGMGGMSTSVSSFSSSSSSGGGMSRSTSTSTYIGPDGRRITRKETTGA